MNIFHTIKKHSGVEPEQLQRVIEILRSQKEGEIVFYSQIHKKTDIPPKQIIKILITMNALKLLTCEYVIRHADCNKLLTDPFDDREEFHLFIQSKSFSTECLKCGQEIEGVEDLKLETRFKIGSNFHSDTQDILE